MKDTDLVINKKIPHVAGYLYGGEKPYNLIDRVVEVLRPTSVLDVGCGPCAALHRFRERGVEELRGLDGDPQLLSHPYAQPFAPQLWIHDLETGPWVHSQYDLVWSYECAEHIKNADSFVQTLAGNAKRWIVLSHAVDNKGGHHHVNGQPKEYWIARFVTLGFVYCPGLTQLLKEANEKDESRYFAGNRLGQGNGLVLWRDKA
jgi:hypothetical protein